MTLAGLISAVRAKGSTMDRERILFLGAGEAGLGIASLIVAHLVKDGLSLAEARERCWLLDSRGLIHSGRRDELAKHGHKLPFAHDLPSGVKEALDLEAAVDAIKPTAIIGVSGKQGTFTKNAIEAMGRCVAAALPRTHRAPGHG